MYLEKIEAFIKKLKESKNIDIHSVAVHPPIARKELKNISSDLNLSDPLMAFYMEVNGFQVSYTFKKNKDFNKADFGYYDDSFPFMWPNDNYWHLDGCINILPIEFIVRNNWKDYIWFETNVQSTITFNGTGMNRSEFEKQIKPLDVFSKDSIAVYYYDKNKFEILLSTDHNSSFTDYKPVDFETYFKGLIETAGLLDERQKIFKLS